MRFPVGAAAGCDLLLFWDTRESDPHAAQRVDDIAQGAGNGRVFEFEAINRQVHAIGDAGVLRGAFQFDFRFDLRHQRMQIFTLGFGQRRILLQLLAQGVELFLQFLGGHGVVPFIKRHWH